MPVWAAAAPASRRGGDHIVAIVNRELVTNSEVQLRVARIEQEAARSGTRLPDRDTLQREVRDQLIDERAQLSQARESGTRVDEAEIDRALANVAAQNQLKAQGMTPWVVKGEAFGELIRKETALWAPVVKSHHIVAQ